MGEGGPRKVALSRGCAKRGGRGEEYIREAGGEGSGGEVSCSSEVSHCGEIGGASEGSEA